MLTKQPSLLDCLPESVRENLDPALANTKLKLSEVWKKTRPGIVSFVKRRPKVALLILFLAGYMVASAVGHIILTAFVAVGGLAFILFAWVDRMRRLWQAILALDVPTITAILQEMLVAASVSFLLALMATGVTGVFVVLLGEILLTFYGSIRDLLKEDHALAPALS